MLPEVVIRLLATSIGTLLSSKVVGSDFPTYNLLALALQKCVHVMVVCKPCGSACTRSQLRVNFASMMSGEAETSSSSWGSDAEEETAGDHNSLWTLEFQAAEDGTSDILEDTAIFQSSADFSHDSTVEAPSAEQSGAGEPDWVKPWSSPNTQSSKLKENCVQQSKADQASQQTPRSKFQSEPLSEEHKTAIIGENCLPCNTQLEMYLRRHHGMHQ